MFFSNFFPTFFKKSHFYLTFPNFCHFSLFFLTFPDHVATLHIPRKKNTEVLNNLKTIIFISITGLSNPEFFFNQTRISQTFFTIGLLNRNLKSYTSSKKITQKTTIKTPKTFFLLFIIKSRTSSVSSKVWPLYGPFALNGPQNFCHGP